MKHRLEDNCNFKIVSYFVPHAMYIFYINYHSFNVSRLQRKQKHPNFDGHKQFIITEFDCRAAVPNLF